MYNVGIVFEILDKDKTAPVGWSKESDHLVFDVNMDFSRKARWVLDRHQSADPIESADRWPSKTQRAFREKSILISNTR